MTIALAEATRHARRPQALPEPWAQARRIDPTVDVKPENLPALNRRRLRAVPFSRDLLFSSMASGEPVIFDNLPVPVRGDQRVGTREAVLRALEAGLPRDVTIRARCGPAEQRKYLAADELLRRWRGNDARVIVTDLHIRGTRVMQSIDTSRLSDFNILASSRGEVGSQEMLTMVVSSAGAMTDSHSDDPDGSNHCFAGKKLWLAWDTFAGLERNLQDVERCSIDTAASFSIRDFLRVPGSRWFLVEAGQTLFLPGHLSHKVLTLEKYLGIGSFFVMLPSYVRTLERWTRRTPLWALSLAPARRLELVDEITRRVTERVRSLADAPMAERTRWGLAHLRAAALAWRETAPAQRQKLLLDRPVSRSFVESALAIDATAGAVPSLRLPKEGFAEGLLANRAS